MAESLGGGWECYEGLDGRGEKLTAKTQGYTGPVVNPGPYDG